MIVVANKDGKISLRVSGDISSLEDLEKFTEALRRQAARAWDAPVAEAKKENSGMTIGLCVIVRDEAATITRLLESVEQLVDFFLIEDTGSTDDTMQIANDWIANRAQYRGIVTQEPWVDFAHNRTHALQSLRAAAPDVDYALVMDADDVLVPEEGFDPPAFLRGLSASLLDVTVRHGDAVFIRPQLFSTRIPFRFRGVLHEYLETPPGPAPSRDYARGFHIRTGAGGVRARDPRKYQKDAAVLMAAINAEEDPILRLRYAFYLAQSWRDAGERDSALHGYLERAKMGGWPEEVYYSWLQAARLTEALAPDNRELILARYLRAHEAVPNRAEAPHGASRALSWMGRHDEAYEMATKALVPMPPQALFSESWIYDYGAHDEVGNSGYWAGRPREALRSCLKALQAATLPEAHRVRIATNAAFSLKLIESFVPEGRIDLPA